MKKLERDWLMKSGRSEEAEWMDEDGDDNWCTNAVSFQSRQIQSAGAWKDAAAASSVEK